MMEKIAAWLFRNQIRGRTRFHAFFLKNRRISSQSKHGITFRLDPREYVDSFVLREGFYEEEVLLAILDNLKDNEVFWDVGSNLGLHAITVAKLRKNARVFAFEPVPSLAQLIRETADNNQVNVSLFETALADRDGEAEFFVHSGNIGRSSLHNWDKKNGLRPIQVEIARADTLLRTEGIDTPNVIKIDVEGGETEVLQGMEQLLKGSSVYTVIFEDSKFEDSPPKVLLRSFGFSLRTLSRFENSSHDLENFIATKESPKIPNPE